MGTPRYRYLSVDTDDGPAQVTLHRRLKKKKLVWMMFFWDEYEWSLGRLELDLIAEWWTGYIDGANPRITDRLAESLICATSDSIIEFVLFREDEERGRKKVLEIMEKHLKCSLRGLRHLSELRA